MEPNTKTVDCPFHPHSHKAVLYKHGHKFAGIWECPKGYSDNCEHKGGREIADTVQDMMDLDGHYQIEGKVYVCIDCKCSMPGDPEEDRLEAIAETQLMETLEK